MIVGRTNLNYVELKRFVGKPQELVAYTENLVPVWARHVSAIVDNQRYYVAIHLRNVLTIPYKQRKELVDALIKGITITGVMSSFTSITEIVDACDKSMFIKMVEVKYNEEKK